MYVSGKVVGRPIALEKLSAFSKPSNSVISIIGLGYVGVVSTACLSQLGHDVIGVDICQDKLRLIDQGKAPIAEAGLGDLLQAGVDNGSISTEYDLKTAILQSDVSFISVNTPTAEDGSCDVGAIQMVAEQIGRALKHKSDYHLLVMRCSVPPGTTESIFIPLVERVSGKKEGADFGVCFNPEFLREGTAIADFQAPPKTVIGARNEKAQFVLAAILEPVDAQPIFTDIATSEMVKYVDNVWHATKVCFGNEIGRVCQSLGIDGREVIRQFSRDTVLNISAYYLKPGFAYGGSCLPKEVRAMKFLGSQHGLSLPLMDSLPVSNDLQVEWAYEMVMKTGARKVGLCGITFKPDTDDLRESPTLRLAGMLLNAGLEVYVNDPSFVCASQMSRQVTNLRRSYSEDADILERLSYCLLPEISDLLAQTELLVTSHETGEWRTLLQDAISDHHIVDVARLFGRYPACKSYHGIGW